jgi:glycosyltransferase involved in cell wall biosynthesis
VKLPERILYVHNSADIYGASRSLLRLLPQIRARGIQPIVLLPEEGPLKDRIEALGIAVVVDPSLSVIDRSAVKSIRLIRLILTFPISVWKIFRLLKSERIDLVHTNTGVMPSPAAAAMLARRPHVWHIRDSFHEFRALWPVYRRYIVAFSRRVICVSTAIAGQFPKTGKVTVIHNGVPLDEFPDQRKEWRARFREKFRLGDALVIGCVGRIKFVRKGQEILMQAAALLKQRGLAAKYLIVGTTSPGNEAHLERLQQLINELRLESDVVFTGELADPRPAYAAMDLFVLPSAQPEPFGGVVLEAMALRLPVVATAVGGSLDQVAEGETGFLVPPADARILSERITLLLQDATLRNRMGEAGRLRLETCFSIGRMMEKVISVYEQAMLSVGLAVLARWMVCAMALVVGALLVDMERTFRAS